MTPGTYNLELYRGDTAAFRFRLWQDTAQSVPVDLTGATVEAEIRDVSGGTRVVPLTVTPSLPNTVDLVIAPTDYVTMPASGVWDLQVTFPDSSVHTPIRGTVTVAGDVTDSVPAPAVERVR